jgi:DNA-binding transcriptional LysR family regulator
MTHAFDLELVVRIVEAGSLSGAAKLLGTPRATVARRLAALEARLGVRLFQRSTRELSLTEAGREFHARAQTILGEIRDMEEAIQRFDERPRGRLRIAMPIAGLEGVLAPFLARFCLRYPEVQVEAMLTSDLDQLVARGFDLALQGRHPPPGSLVVRCLLHGRVQLMAGPAYLARRGTPQQVEDLEHHDVLAQVEQGVTVSWPIQDGRSFTCRRPRLAANSADLIRRAAMAGLGIALLPNVLVRRELAEGRLSVVLSEQVGITAPVNLLYPAREHLPARVRAFLDFAREEALRFEAGEDFEGEE